MIIPFQSLHTLFPSLRQVAQSGSSVLILTATPDVDALCACKIVSSVLKTESIPHEIIPVSGYPDLAKANEEHVEGNTTLRALILLNCGGAVDLEEFFTLTQDMDIYVLDAHRPFNLNNLYLNQRIHVLDDGEFGAEEMEEVKTAFIELEDDLDRNSGDDDDGESDLDEEDDEDEEEDGEEDDDEEEEENQVSVDGDTSQPGDHSTSSPTDPKKKKKKRRNAMDDLFAHQNKRLKAAQLRKRRQNQQALIAEYYGDGTYFGMSIASLAFTMADQLGLSNNDELWFSIIGLTDQFLHEKMSATKYHSLVTLYQGQVALLNVNNPTGDSAKKSKAWDAEDDDEDEDAELLFGEPNAKKSKPPSRVNGGGDDYSISAHEDYRLVFLNHWSFAESMYHSPYVAAKLGLWREKGRMRLVNLFAKMGMPHKEAQQQFREMKTVYKSKIRQKLTELAPKFNIPDILFPSFRKRFGYKCTLTASDIVYALSTLMSCGKRWILQGELSRYDENAMAIGSNSLGLGRQRMGGVSSLSSVEFASGNLRIDSQHNSFASSGSAALYKALVSRITDPAFASRPTWLTNFYLAYDALDNVDLMFRGIHLAIHFQRSLLSTGLSILDRKLIKSAIYFRFVILKPSNFLFPSGMASLVAVSKSGEAEDGSESVLRPMNSGDFGGSIALLGRLASFLMDANREYNTSQRYLPLVMATLHEPSDSYLVLGSAGVSKSGKLLKNTFGVAFQAAASASRARVRPDSFESNVVEVDGDDITAFLDALQKELAAGQDD